MAAALVLDDAPPTLLRFFDVESYARELVEHGRLRMRPVQAYVAAPGLRRDDAEGKSHLRIPGSVPRVAVDVAAGKFSAPWEEPGHFEFGGEFMNPTYVFCTTQPGVDRSSLRVRFGSYVVTILSPSAFAAALLSGAAAAAAQAGRELLFLDGCPVRYDKGEVGAHPTHEERLRLHFAQKPPAYALEQEFRFAAALSGPRAGAPAQLEISLAAFSGMFTMQVT
jgi:hypothetical protein